VSRTPAARVNALLSKAEQRRLLAAMGLTPSGVPYGPTRDEERRTVFRGISFVPPKKAREEAALGLELVASGYSGGTDIGYGRAVQLATKATIYPRDVYRMKDYFTRHAVDLRSPAAQRGEITPGVIGWLIWGGDAGRAWAEKIVARMEAAQARRNPGATKRTQPALWARIVREVTAGAKGGLPGQWSARKAQLAVSLYKQRGGGYVGARSPTNTLTAWTREHWRTKSGAPSLVTGERYLPAAAIEALSPQEYGATTRAKRRGLEAGEQFTPQPPRIAAKVARYRRR